MIRLCNCADCGAELVGESSESNDFATIKREGAGRERVAGRIRDRPYCRGCLAVSSAGVSGLAGGMATDFSSPSPWHENAVRAGEEGS